MSKKEFNCFKLDVKNHVANLVLSRPDELNTMSRDFWVELGEVLEVIGVLIFWHGKILVKIGF